MSDSVSPVPSAPIKKKGKTWMIAAAAIVIVLALVAVAVVGGFLTNNETALEKIKRTGKIVMATEASFIPFESVNPSTGEFLGFDIDLAQRITENVSAELGVPVTLEVRDVLFNTIPVSMSNRQFDMSLSGMTITDLRNETLLFSTPYYMAEAGFGILCLADNDKFVNPADIENATTIVVNSGTTSELWVQKYLVDTGKIAANKVKHLGTIANCATDVEIGQSELFLIDKPTAEEYADLSDGAMKVSAVIPSFEPYGVAFNKGDADLKAIVDRVITEMIANGEMEALREKWGLN